MGLPVSENFSACFENSVKQPRGSSTSAFIPDMHITCSRNKPKDGRLHTIEIIFSLSLRKSFWLLLSANGVNSLIKNKRFRSRHTESSNSL